MNNNDKIKLIQSRFGSSGIFNKDKQHPHLMYNCPFCEQRRGKKDTSHKLYVSIIKLKFYCFKCRAKGSLIKDTEISNSSVYKDLIDLYDDNIEEDNDNMFYLPNIKISTSSLAYEYLRKRGIDDEKIDYYGIRFGINDLFGRIVIPNILYNDLWTDMYQARSYIGQEPKYKNPGDSHKSDAVFNLHRLDKGGVCNVVEGAITSICAGKDSCGTYGSSPSNEQLTKIISHEFEEINCCYDYDPSGIKGNKKLAEELKIRSNPNRTKIYIVDMPPGIDAADMGEKEFKKYVYSNRVEYFSNDNVYTRLLKM